MSAFAKRALLALRFACVPSLLAGCNGGTTPPAIPASSPHFTMPHADAGSIKIWAAAAQTSTVFGLSLGAKRVLKVISTESQPVKGGDPLTLKVDRAKNLFVTDISGGKAGVIQEYKSGSFTSAYSPDCAVSDCSNLQVCSATPSSIIAMSSRSWNESNTRSEAIPSAAAATNTGPRGIRRQHPLPYSSAAIVR